MPVTKTYKTLIKNLFKLGYNNAKKVSWQRWNVGSLQVVTKATGYWVSRPSYRHRRTMLCPHC